MPASGSYSSKKSDSILIGNVATSRSKPAFPAVHGIWCRCQTLGSDFWFSFEQANILSSRERFGKSEVLVKAWECSRSFFSQEVVTNNDCRVLVPYVALQSSHENA